MNYRGIYRCRLCNQKVYTKYTYSAKSNGFAIFECTPLYMEHICEEKNAPEEGHTLQGLCDLIGAEEIEDGEQ